MELETEAADRLHWRTQVWSQPTVAQLAEQQTVVGGGGGFAICGYLLVTGSIPVRRNF